MLKLRDEVFLLARGEEPIRYFSTPFSNQWSLSFEKFWLDVKMEMFNTKGMSLCVICFDKNQIVKKTKTLGIKKYFEVKDSGDEVEISKDSWVERRKALMNSFEFIKNRNAVLTIIRDLLPQPIFEELIEHL